MSIFAIHPQFRSAQILAAAIFFAATQVSGESSALDLTGGTSAVRQLFFYMSTLANQDGRLRHHLAMRDAIIHALYLKLKAERETRDTIAEAASHGASPEVIEAMASDPVPPIDDLGETETVRMLIHHFQAAKRARVATALEEGG